MRSSTPHTLQRYRTLTRRNSPSGGGPGSGVVTLRIIPIPTFHRV